MVICMKLYDKYNPKKQKNFCKIFRICRNETSLEGFDQVLKYEKETENRPTFIYKIDNFVS